MAFPSSVGTKADAPREAWDAIRGTVGQIKVNTANLNTASAAGDVPADRVTRYVALLSDALDALARWTAVPGLLAYARAQLNDPTFDIVAEYNAMRAQVEACRDWIITNFPKDGTGYLLYHQFGVGGRISVRQFAPATLAGLRTQLDLLLATID